VQQKLLVTESEFANNLNISQFITNRQNIPQRHIPGWATQYTCRCAWISFGPSEFSELIT